MPEGYFNFLDKTYGHPKPEWDETRAWMTRRLHAIARAQSKITYGELCREAAAAGHLALEPHGTPLAGLLGQINVDERERGRPLVLCRRSQD
jgi:hypothetical protein